MAMRSAARFVTRRFSTGGKILSEEEKAAENIFIKKLEKEKLEKLAHKGPKPEEQAASTGGAVADAKPVSNSTSATASVSTDKNRNYAVLAGTITGLAAFGWWYIRSKEKKPEEVQED